MNDNTAWTVRTEPKESLVRNGLLFFVLVSLVLFGSLYFLTAPLGTWPAVLVAHVMVGGLLLAAYVRHRRAFAGVRGDFVVKRSLIRRARCVPRSAVDSIVLVETYRSNSTDTVPHLLLRDSSGALLLRMRGHYWSENSMHEIAGALDVRMQHVADPLTPKQFVTNYPGSAHWGEARPILGALTVASAVALSMGVILGLMFLAGIPIRLGG